MILYIYILDLKWTLTCCISDLSIVPDASYSDPLGPQERPRTAARTRSQLDDEFGDEDLAEYLLPE